MKTTLLVLLAVAWLGCLNSDVTLSSPYLTGRVEVDRNTDVRANGVDRVRVFVKVFDSDLTDIPGRRVRIRANGALANSPASATNDLGVAEGYVTSLTPGDVAISAVVITDAGEVELPDVHTVTFTQDASDAVTFAAAQTVQTGVQPYGLATVDINKDGRDDLLATQWGAGTLSLLQGGVGGLEPNGAAIPVGEFPRAVATAPHGDATRVFLVHPTLNKLGVWEFDGLTESIKGMYDTGATPRHVVVIDLDGQDELDVVVANANGFSVATYLGNADGVEHHQTLGAGLTPAALAAGDYNGDGHSDIAVADPAGGAVLLLLNDGEGHLTQGEELLVPIATHLTRFDANGDGLDDLAVVSGRNATVHTFVQAAGALVVGPTLVLEGSLEAVGHADLNHDGNDEILVVNTPGAVVWVLRQDAAVLEVVASLRTGLGPVDICTGDWNRDGKTDLATANYNGASLSVFYGE